MSDRLERSDPGYWESRVFRASFTYRGQRRRVAGWSMKVQWAGERRTLRLRSADRTQAAREASEVYRQLIQDGWTGIEGRHPGRRAADGRPEVAHPSAPPQVAPRKYVGHLNSGFSRELFATLRHQGKTEHLPLGTEDPNLGRLRANELQGELERVGWSPLKLMHAWEATVAVFWRSNPMTCTYTTLLTHPARRGQTPPLACAERGWRILVVEPDGGVRRALAHWLGRNPHVASVHACPRAGEVSNTGDWDLILANREQPAATLRELSATPARRSPCLLTHGVFADSDAIFASFSGVSRGYLLRRVPPADLLEPLLPLFPDGPPKTPLDVDRQTSRYFQSLFEPAGVRATGQMADLTVRELEILDLLSRGFADKEIGNELGISVWTVHSHLKRIFAKFGVRTRTEAVVRHLQK